MNCETRSHDCRLCSFFNSSLGQKFLVGGAGLMLCGFLLMHLAGNLFLFVGEGAFNHYAETLEQNPLLPIAEIGLAALFILHIITALYLKVKNRQARPVAYETAASKGGRTPGSRSMALSGTLVLAFLIVHLKTFKFGEDPEGLFRLVMAWFKNPYYAGFYVLAMGGLALHLSHGVQSAFNTLGISHPRYTPLIKAAGVAFAVLVCGGFAVIPLWACFIK